MRSARILLATATATAALAIAAPAYAEGSGGWDHEDSSYSKEHDNSYGKEHDKDSSHGKPHGGMHTGGGALTLLSDDDWGGSPRDPKQDPETYKKDNGGSDWGGKTSGNDSWGGGSDSGSWSGDHDKPKGGMHTGGGALATPGVTAGGLAAVAVAGAGLFALRRKKVSGSVA
ncbi:hypothetical protein C3489_22290 [Streptomyces sp. Ru71]|uniref:hypothetical protein n=1 Tax=Streptomyces sp. Ru71 TaxID=2080746 RepID=UPI000CDD47BF|nr:hypothetical protein [Streptomyces sp. Ru71]POX50382.1 hypothetical protein C3489_22290 [Streptomyces sp. Ru71]